MNSCCRHKARQKHAKLKRGWTPHLGSAAPLNTRHQCPNAFIPGTGAARRNRDTITTGLFEQNQTKLALSAHNLHRWIEQIIPSRLILISICFEGLGRVHSYKEQLGTSLRIWQQVRARAVIAARSGPRAEPAAPFIPCARLAPSLCLLLCFTKLLARKAHRRYLPPRAPKHTHTTVSSSLSNAPLHIAVLFFNTAQRTSTATTRFYACNCYRTLF